MPAAALDLSDVAAVTPGLLRVHGSVGNGGFGLPVAGGHDVDGDGETDIAFAAIRASPLSRNNAGEADSGAVYLVRGGAHLDVGGVIDLANFGVTSLAGDLAKITPPAGSSEYHFGATCQIGDLDGDGYSNIAFSSPHGDAAGRDEAGIIHIAHRQSGPFPERVDLRAGENPNPSGASRNAILGRAEITQR